MRTSFSSFLQRLALAMVNLFESPLGSALTAAWVYFLVSGGAGRLFGPSHFAYYNYLADAFLHGQTWLRVLPQTTHDLVPYNGRYFLYWSPFPAVVLMPFVALFGVQFNDVLFTICIASLDIALMSLLLRAASRAGFLHLSKAQRALLIFFFAFGTVFFTLAPYGKVWMTGQLIGFTCVLVAYLAAFSLHGSKAWFFTGLALACAMLTRSHMVFTGIFPAVYLLFQEKPWNWKSVLSRLAWAALPLTIGLLVFLGYNVQRFGNPFEMGISYHNMDEIFRADFNQYGAFNLHYLPINFFYQYIAYPFPLTQESAMGGSLFLLSPLFVAAFAAFWKPRSKWFVFALAASILITNIPILMLMGTGWVQFGPRYTLDFTVPLLLLTAIGMEKWSKITPLLLTAVSVVQYTIGTIWLR